LQHGFIAGADEEPAALAVERGRQLIKPYPASTSPQPVDGTHLSLLSVKHALFGLWQSSEDQDQSAPAISFQVWQRVGS